MAEDAIRRTSHSMGTHKQDRIASLLKRCDVACPGIAENILSARFQVFRDEALKAVCSSGSVAVNDYDLTRPRRTGTTHGGIHLVGIEFSALFIKSCARGNLFPGLYAGDAFHITKDNNAHNVPSFFHNFRVAFILRRLYVLYRTTGGSYSRYSFLPIFQPK